MIIIVLSLIISYQITIYSYLVKGAGSIENILVLIFYIPDKGLSLHLSKACICAQLLPQKYVNITHKLFYIVKQILVCKVQPELRKEWSHEVQQMLAISLIYDQTLYEDDCKTFVAYFVAVIALLKIIKQMYLAQNVCLVFCICKWVPVNKDNVLFWMTMISY